MVRFHAVERVRVETVRGKRLLVTDLSGLDGNDAPAVLQQTHLQLARLPKERSVLSLLIVRDVRMDARITEEMRRVSKLNAPWVAATAVVGMSAIGQVIARGVSLITGRSFKAFSSEEEARAWLLASGAKPA